MRTFAVSLFILCPLFTILASIVNDMKKILWGTFFGSYDKTNGGLLG